MILSSEEIINIIKYPKYKGFVEMAQKNQIDHDRHVSGKNYKDLIKPLKGFEKEDQKKVKEQLSQPATRSIVSDLKNQLSKWQSASDTNKDYVFKDKELNKNFVKDVLSKVWKGESINYFVNFFLKDALWNKFNDFLIVNRPYLITKDIDGQNIEFEVRDGVEKVHTSGTELYPYIAHISIHAVHDFFIYGNKVEYLAYLSEIIKDESGKDYKIYKVLDDRGIYTVKDDCLKKDNSIQIINFTANELSELPVIRVSSLISIVYPNTATSFLEPALHKLDAYVDDFAVYRASKVQHAYPQRFSAGAKCNYQDESLDSSICQGTGKIDITDNNERRTIVCPKCFGTGWNTVRDASQDFIVPFFLEENQRPYTTTPIGYAAVDITILTFQKDDLQTNSDDIKEHILQRNTLLENSIQKTATAVLENREPVVLLNMLFAKLISFTETKLTDWIGELYKPEQFQKAVINYGLNYANKNKDQITEEISNGRSAGLSITEITQLHKNRIKSANSNNIDKLIKQKMLFDLEPFNTLTIDEVEKSETILPIDKMHKLYFPQYIRELMQAGKINIELLKDKDNYFKIIEDINNQVKQLNKTKFDDSTEITSVDRTED